MSEPPQNPRLGGVVEPDPRQGEGSQSVPLTIGNPNLTFVTGYQPFVLREEDKHMLCRRMAEETSPQERNGTTPSSE